MSDELRSNSNLTHQEIIENAPATVGGYPGFNLYYAYRTDDRLKVEGILLRRDGWHLALLCACMRLRPKFTLRKTSRCSRRCAIVFKSAKARRKSCFRGAQSHCRKTNYPLAEWIDRSSRGRRVAGLERNTHREKKMGQMSALSKSYLGQVVASSSLVESKMIANSSVVDSLVLYARTPHAPVRKVIQEKRYAVVFPEGVPYF